MTSFLATPGPRWRTIPPHRPFAEDLARGVLAALAEQGPEALADAVLLTPTRRSGRELAHAFLAAGDAPAALLPRIRPLGDLDEGEPPFEPADIALGLPPAIAPWRRRFELARLVKAHETALKRDLDAAGALALADALGAFLDSCHLEERTDPDAIDALAGADHAEHWKISADFLKIALVAWPARLAELGLVDEAARRVTLLRRLAESWRARPPTGLLVAAGSTGTAPATAALLGVIAGAPQGCVVLPGLDQDLADSAWDEIEEHHPQASLRRLLAGAGVSRRDVKLWPESQAPDARARWRRRVISEALRPAARTDDWLAQIGALREEAGEEAADPVAQALQGLSLVAARSEEEAAAAAAVLIRETLEREGATAALITPDQALARRVSARLGRWGIEADTSAGAPLAGFAPAVLATLAARAAADPADPVALLGLLKSPLTRLGLAPQDLETERAALERHALRGARTQDAAGLEARLETLRAEAEQGRRPYARAIPEIDLALGLLGRLQAALSPVVDLFVDGAVPVAGAGRALTETLEILAEGPDGGTGKLWAGPAGDAASRLLAALIADSDGLPPVTAGGFLTLLQALLDGETVRGGGAAHPRVRILGTIEARMVRADRLILAGLEEGVWPAGAQIDPFLSRPMRKVLGLPPPERRIGLSAHDFAQAAAAPDVVLLRTERRGGSPAIASRWLWRLQTLVKGAGLVLPDRPDILAWAGRLDEPIADPPPSLRPAAAPAPRPPVEERPRVLAVTRIEALVRDPYAIYAQYILGLQALERPDAPTDARVRGTAIHAALEAYANAWPAPAERFADLYLAELAKAGMPAAARVRERPLALRSGLWLQAFERERRAGGARVILEAEGRTTIAAPFGLFTVTAKADRIEVDQGRAHVIDFKTGGAPTKKMIETGFSPQLTLTAFILSEGGFKGLGRLPPGDLAYVQLSGREPAGKVEVRASAGGKVDSLALMQEVAEGLHKLIARYDHPSTAYRSRAAPQWAASPGEDYDHLARVREWSTAEAEAEE